jgi:hypothetical protein
VTIDDLESRSRSRSSSARTVHRSGGNVRRAATKDDAGPLLWLLILAMFLSCLILAIACIRHERTMWAGYR